MCWPHVKMWASSLGWKELGYLISWRILFDIGVSAVTSCHSRALRRKPFLVTSKFSLDDCVPLTSTYFDTLNALSSWPQKVYKLYNVLDLNVFPFHYIHKTNSSSWLLGGILRITEVDFWNFLSCSDERNKALILLITWPCCQWAHRVRWKQGKTRWNQRHPQQSREA